MTLARGAARLPVLVLLVLVVMGASAAVAVAKDPRREQERLRPADMALAGRVAVRASDLAQGWTQTAVPGDDGASMSCPGFRPDFSRFTISGKSRTAFSSTGGRSIVSLVEVYATKAQAVGDFRLGAQPAVARCLRTTLEGAVPDGTNVVLRVRSSRMLPLDVGENGAVFRLVASLSSGNVSLPLYLDALVFQRGRTITALLFTSAVERVPGQLALARAVVRRMR